MKFFSLLILFLASISRVGFANCEGKLLKIPDAKIYHAVPGPTDSGAHHVGPIHICMKDIGAKSYWGMWPEKNSYVYSFENYKALFRIFAQYWNQGKRLSLVLASGDVGDTLLESGTPKRATTLTYIKNVDLEKPDVSSWPALYTTLDKVDDKSPRVIFSFD